MKESQPKELVTLRRRPMKDGGFSLLLDYMDGGVRHREFLKMYLVPESSKIDRFKNQETLKVANALKAKRILELQSGRAGFRSRDGSKVTLAGYMEEKREEYRNAGIRYDHIIRMCRAHVIRYKGDGVRLSQVDKAYVLGFIDYLRNAKLADSTRYNYFTALNVVLNAAVRDELIAENPSRKIEPKRKPSPKEGARDFLSIDEVRALADAPCRKAALKSAFMFACFTGLRISDIRALVWENVTDTGEGLQVQLRQKKTDDPVYVPLSENAMRWLPKRKEKGSVFGILPVDPSLGRTLAEWAKTAGITKHVTFHVSRHTYATMLLTYGADIYTVSSLMGHKSVATTSIYAKIVDEKKRRAVDMIPDL